LTKQDELLKYPLDENLNNLKIELMPQLTDNNSNLHLCNTNCLHIDQDKIVIQHKKSTTKTQLEKATNQLYNIENHNIAEKTLNIDLDLYQMEDYY